MNIGTEVGKNTKSTHIMAWCVAMLGKHYSTKINNHQVTIEYVNTACCVWNP